MAMPSAFSTPMTRTDEKGDHDDGTRAMRAETMTRQAVRQRIPAGVWALGLVSMLLDIITETAPAELRGTAFGMFNLGPQGTFLVGAAFTLLTLAGLLVIHGRLRGRADA